MFFPRTRRTLPSKKPRIEEQAAKHKKWTFGPLNLTAFDHYKSHYQYQA
jgi:hypothetical protein